MSQDSGVVAGGLGSLGFGLVRPLGPCTPPACTRTPAPIAYPQVWEAHRLLGRGEGAFTARMTALWSPSSRPRKTGVFRLHVHSGRLAWNLKGGHVKRTLSKKRAPVRFKVHVSFPECRSLAPQ